MYTCVASKEMQNETRGLLVSEIVVGIRLEITRESEGDGFPGNETTLIGDGETDNPVSHIIAQ